MNIRDQGELGYIPDPSSKCDYCPHALDDHESLDIENLDGYLLKCPIVGCNCLISGQYPSTDDEDNKETCTLKPHQLSAFQRFKVKFAQWLLRGTA